MQINTVSKFTVCRNSLLASAMALILLASLTVNAKSRAQKFTSVKPNLQFVEKKLLKNGFSKAFVRDLMVAYEPRDFASVIELNVLLFLRKTDYHGPQVNEEALRQVRKFSEINRESLQRAEELNRVPSAVIASLLWIESRHGKNAGDFHVPSVYLHLLQAQRTSVQKFLLTRTGKYADHTTKAERKEIIARTHRKSAWAITELRALEKVYRWKWKMGPEFRGSFSGAFGIPQFIPSSYVKWARSMKSDSQPTAQPNLMQPPDSILSVAYYLRDHGWLTDAADSHVTALMTYNNSRDYANAILSLASKVEARVTASQPEEGR